MILSRTLSKLGFYLNEKHKDKQIYYELKNQISSLSKGNNLKKLKINFEKKKLIRWQAFNLLQPIGKICELKG